MIKIILKTDDSLEKKNGILYDFCLENSLKLEKYLHGKHALLLRSATLAVQKMIVVCQIHPMFSLILSKYFLGIGGE